MFKFKQYDFKQYNISLLMVIIILGSIGAFLIKQVELEHESLFEKQIIGLFIGILIAIIVSMFDYHFLGKLYIVFYIVNIVLLVLVKLIGVERNYAKRWLNLKYIEFQPSELSKIILIIFLAKLFTVFQDKINNVFFLLITVIAMALPVLLIMTQTDLSTSLVIIFVFIMITFAAGLDWKIIALFLIIGIPTITGLFWYVQQDYQVLLSSTQQQRVLSILNPEEYPDTMYQQANSIQAIGSGQLVGKRFSDDVSEIRGYDYVPISESDFIFSVAGEEFGFIGSCFILFLFAIIIYKYLITAKKAPDRLGMLIAVGLSSQLMFQVFVNLGVATALLPNTGIPLPFLSSGLSSLTSSMIAVGIILNIRLQTK